MDKILKIIEEVTMKKCRYCGKELDSNLEFCSSECENSYRKIIEKDRHKIKYFISSIILGFLDIFSFITSIPPIFNSIFSRLSFIVPAVKYIFTKTRII